MNITIGCLPQQPSVAEACEHIKNAPLQQWLPVLAHLQQAFGLPAGVWQRIPQGANALFQLGEDIVVKLVPPNWRRQGDKELLVAPLLAGRLSLETPPCIGGGEIDQWVFVIASRLQGSSLADVWPTLPLEQKRPLMQQVGLLMRELRSIPIDTGNAIQVHWQDYIATLIETCMARHRRRGMPAHLAEQVMPYLAQPAAFAPAGQARFIHMDIHPWNLMAREVDGQWTLTGLLDFGDAIIGNCDRFEMITPMMFMAQGDPLLVKTMLDTYGLAGTDDAPALRRQLMASALIRPDSDLGFCMQQVAVSGPRETWEQIALQMFPV